METNPYLIGLKMVKQHSGTSGQAALAKCILSLYNPNHSFSMGEILGALDENYTKAILDMVHAYAKHGETEELRQAGEWVYDNFPRMIELSTAAHEAKCAVRSKWEAERDRETLEEERREEARTERDRIERQNLVAKIAKERPARTAYRSGAVLVLGEGEPVECGGSDVAVQIQGTGWRVYYSYQNQTHSTNELHASIEDAVLEALDFF